MCEIYLVLFVIWSILSKVYFGTIELASEPATELTAALIRNRIDIRKS